MRTWDWYVLKIVRLPVGDDLPFKAIAKIPTAATLGCTPLWFFWAARTQMLGIAVTGFTSISAKSVSFMYPPAEVRC